jgi:hypothetical protein
MKNIFYQGTMRLFFRSADETPNAAYFLLLAAYFTVCWERRRLAGGAKLKRNSLGSYGIFAFECSGCGFWPPLAGETPALPATREIIFVRHIVRLLRNSEQKVCGIR